MAVGRGVKEVKTVGNAAVASGLPSAPLTPARGGEGGTKIAAVNVKAATGGGAGGGLKAYLSGGGGGGGGGGIFIGAREELSSSNRRW